MSPARRWLTPRFDQETPDCDAAARGGVEGLGSRCYHGPHDRQHLGPPRVALRAGCERCGSAGVRPRPLLRHRGRRRADRRGVPKVELQTTYGGRYYSDSAGLIAFDEPGLMGKRVFFGVEAHGYEFAKDGFGVRGVALQADPGGHARLEVKRINIAERLYRITGQGVYRDSVILGRKPPVAEPLLNAEVTGQDSVLNAEYRGKLYWFYGDTSRLSYALGNFATSGATTGPPETI